MSSIPEFNVQGFAPIPFNSSIRINEAAPVALTWEGDGRKFSAVTPEGVWHLELNAVKNGTKVKFSGTLNAVTDHLEVTLFQIPSFAADHVLPQTIRMGGCKAFDLTQPPSQDAIVGELLFSVTRDGRTMQLSTPFHGGFPMVFSGQAKLREIGNFKAVSSIQFYGGTDIELPVLTIRSGNDGFVLMEEYADENTDVKKTFATPTAGWNSWDYYRWTITEDEVLKNAEFIASDPVLSKHIKRIIVDDGWQYCYGEWEPNFLFPNGMDYLAKTLTGMGFDPGLWFAPAIVEPHCRIAQLDYDMLAMSEGGQPCLAYECMRRFGFILDPTVPKTQDHLEKLFRRYTDMGYKYFKLDFNCSMYKAPRFHDPKVKRDELIPLLFEPIFRGLDGRAVLLGCNYPYTAGNKTVEAVRIGADIHAIWEKIKLNASAISAHFWANKKLWLNDPDFAVCRGVDTSDDPDLARLNPLWPFVNPTDAFDPGRVMKLATAKRCESEVLLSMALMAGGAINLSDKMTLLNKDGLFLARKVVSAESGAAARPIQLFSAALSESFLQKLSSGWRVLLVNWTDVPKDMSFDLNAFGITASQAVDFWKEQSVPCSGGHLEFSSVAPHSCRMIELR